MARTEYDATGRCTCRYLRRRSVRNERLWQARDSILRRSGGGRGVERREALLAVFSISGRMRLLGRSFSVLWRSSHFLSRIFCWEDARRETRGTCDQGICLPVRRRPLRATARPFGTHRRRRKDGIELLRGSTRFTFSSFSSRSRPQTRSRN